MVREHTPRSWSRKIAIIYGFSTVFCDEVGGVDLARQVPEAVLRADGVDLGAVLGVVLGGEVGELDGVDWAASVDRGAAPGEMQSAWTTR